MAGRIDTASRLIAASPERLFDAFINAESQAEWLPPNGMSAIFERFEPRPGGKYRMTLTYDRAGSGKTTDDSDTVSGRFIKLERPNCIVQTADFVSADPRFAGTMTMTWSFRAVGGGTEVTVTASDVPPGISAEDHQAGLSSSLENLARYVESPR